MRGRARGCSRASITLWSWRRARRLDETRARPRGGPRGFDAGKKIKGRKRHIVTDTQGNLVGLVVHEADVQDRDGAPRVFASIRALYPWLRHVFADGGYAGAKLRAALKGNGSWTLEIIKRSDRAKGFELLPRRWVVNHRTMLPV